ncbi:MAG: hypothetical protein HY543_06610 [Deltaproteobacteria bacterium]|nr:hypothetical protein [Deltaproteobacteria bacterium]
MGNLERVEQLPKSHPVRTSGRTRLVLIGAVGIGIATFLAGLGTHPERAWYNYLLNYFYWSCLGIAGVFFVALQYLTGSVWSVTVRRVAEAMAAFLPIAVVLLFGVIAGAHHLYEWTHADVVAAHHLLQKKSAYLNLPFFSLRNISFLLVWLVFGWLLVRNSVRQDDSGDPRLTITNTKLGGAFLLVFAVTFTLASFDLMMSIEPEWFSTIFGVYCFAGLFLSGVAMITLLAVTLYRRRAFGPYLHEHHLFDLGKLMLAFTVFWAYIAFSQFMLIWYADLPEETFYLIKRMSGAWLPVSWVLLVVKFIVPFLLLLPQGPKRRPGYLRALALWILAAHYLDCYWLVVPRFAPQGPVFGWMEIGIFIGFAGLFGLAVSTFLARVPLVPQRDPRLLEAVHFHQ